MRQRRSDSRSPLTAEEYFALAGELAAQQAELAAQQAELLKQLRIGEAQPEGKRPPDPLTQALAAACHNGRYEQIIVDYDDSGGASIRKLVCDSSAPDLVIPQVHNFPQRARCIIRPGAAPSASQIWRNIQDNGEYPTLEGHLANRSPLHRDIGNIIPIYEIVGAKSREINKWQRSSQY